MKKYMVTAAALMLGTSALAWAPAEKAHLAGMTASSDLSASASTASFPAFDKAVMESASASLDASSAMAKGDDLGMKELARWSDATVQTASAGNVAKVADDGGVTLAEADFKSKDDVGGIQTAWAVEQPALTGVGGPIETATGYPACEPGPGDDRCIQLYEPGVHSALAAWKATDDVAMGGPFEPAPAATKDMPSDHQGMDHGSADGHGTSASPAKIPTADDEVADTGTAPAKPAATTTPAPGAIGGPVDTRTGYPPCRPGRGDDRCIQLYERGVTGRDN